MAKFFNLCVNEFVKINKNIITLIFYALIIISFISSFAIVKHIENGNKAIEESYASNAYTEKQFNFASSEIVFGQKAIENGKKSMFYTESTINTYKSKVKYYGYAKDNNIVLENGDKSNYYKYNIINELIAVETENFDLGQKALAETNNLNTLKKQREAKAKDEKLIYLLYEGNFEQYIDYKINSVNDDYKNGIISYDEKELGIYIENLNKKYGVGSENRLDVIWKNTLIQKIKGNKEKLITKETFLSVDEKEEINNTIDLDIYKLQNNIPINNSDIIVNLNDAFVDISCTITMTILAIFVIVVASLIIAEEFSKETIKELVVSPNRRWKILLAKLLTLTFILLVSTIIISIFTQIFGNILFSGNIKNAYMYIKDGKIQTIGASVYRMIEFLSYDIQIFIYMLLSLTLSTLTKSISVSTSVPMFLYIVGSPFTSFINKSVKAEWLKFIPFNNFNIGDKLFTNNSSIVPNIFEYGGNIIVNSMTFGFSIKYILIIVILLIIIMFEEFNKKDIM